LKIEGNKEENGSVVFRVVVEMIRKLKNPCAINQGLMRIFEVY